MFKKIIQTLESFNPFSDHIQANLLVKLLETRRIRINHSDLTPLMIYAATNTTDERFLNLLKGNKEAITKTIHHTNFTGLSALTLAVISGAMNTIQLLLATKAYSDEHIQELAFFAALFNQPKVIPLLHNYGVNLFKRNDFEGVTALHVACANGYTDIVNAILETQPSDHELSMPTFFENETAFQLANEHAHYDCTHLLKHTSSALFLQKCEAFKNKNFAYLIELMSNDKSENPLVGDYFNRSQTFLVPAIVDAVVDSADLPVFNLLYEFLQKQPIEVQINTLILTLAELEQYLNWSQNEMRERLTEFYNPLLEKSKILSEQINMMNSVSLNGLLLSDKTIKIIKPLLQKTSPEIIDLTCYSSDILDEEEDECCTMNLWPIHNTAIVNTILNNTNLTSFNLMTNTANQPYVALIKLVIERNTLLQKEELPILKNKIFNSYVEKINKCIEEIKRNPKLYNTTELNLLEPIISVPSLKEIGALYVNNHCSEKRQTKLPYELQDYVSKAKLPLSLLTFGSVYQSIKPTNESEEECNKLMPR